MASDKVLRAGRGGAGNIQVLKDIKKSSEVGFIDLHSNSPF